MDRFRLFYKRPHNQILGWLTLKEYRPDGSEIVLIDKSPTTSGQKDAFADHLSWISGAGHPIPYGNFFLWTDKCVGPRHLKPGHSGIGTAWAISTDKKNRDVIKDPNSSRTRTLIRHHCDNDWDGSEGCMASETWNDFERFGAQYDRIRGEGIIHIPLYVFQ